MKLDRRNFLRLACVMAAGLPFANFAKMPFRKMGTKFFIYAVPGKYPGKVLTGLGGFRSDKWSG